MPKPPKPSAKSAESRRRAASELQDVYARKEHRPMMAELYRRAEARLREGRKEKVKREKQKAERSEPDSPKQKFRGRREEGGGQRAQGEAARVVHELEVHQIELEMQNAELQKVRGELELALGKYTDLYDFAPVGYCSMDESGMILEANLTGAGLLGVERSRLISRHWLPFVAPVSRPGFQAFLEKVFTGTQEQLCDALLLKAGGDPFWAGVRATPAVSLKGARKWCRVAFGDITARREAEDAQRRVTALADTNRGLYLEIARRRKVERALQKSEQHQRHLQDQLRQLSHRILHTQEEERKRISRELHDEIAQTLVGINIHLAALTRDAAGNPMALQEKIARTQRLVEKSVDVVHRFARELRPTTLDDLGLVPALLAYTKEFTKRTGIHVQFKTFTPGRIKQLNNATRTALYRVAQEALTNVARHAQASRVEVNLAKLPRAICLKIKDDGKSFQVQRTLHPARNKRLGLIGMRERMEMVGGAFSIASARGQGTTVAAQIPLANGGRASEAG